MKRKIIAHLKNETFKNETFKKVQITKQMHKLVGTDGQFEEDYNGLKLWASENLLA